jgi:plasmid maintenance system antidote protein VapI
MDNKVVQLLEDIKKLLILDLISRGVQGKDVAQVLGVNKSTITRIVPAKKINKDS